MLLYPQKPGLISIGGRAEQKSCDCGVPRSQGDDSRETDLRIHTPCWCHILVSGSAFLGDRYKEWVVGWWEKLCLEPSETRLPCQTG